MEFSANGTSSNASDPDRLYLVIETKEGRFPFPLGELMPDPFIERTTNFDSIADLLASCGFDTSNQAAFEAIPDEDWDQFIESESVFSSWREMLHSAGQEWLANQLDQD